MATIQQFMAAHPVTPVEHMEEAVASCLAAYLPTLSTVDAEVTISGGRVAIETSCADLAIVRELAGRCTILKMLSIPYEVMEWR